MIVWHTLRAYLNILLPHYSVEKRMRTIKRSTPSMYTDREVILSLTTYPKRLKTLPLVLDSIYCQTILPSHVILWLADNQFSDKEYVKKTLEKYVNKGLSIRYCDDLRSHKKYYYALKENPDSIIITVDDDIFYPEDMIESLLKKYVEYPDCIITCRAHDMKFENGAPKPYMAWNMLAKGCTSPSLTLCATGGAGCLYPPGCLSEHVFDKEVFMSICLYADDLWLKCMSYIKGTQTVLSEKDNPEIITVKNKKDDGGLAAINVVGQKNDEQLLSVTNYYHIEWKTKD